MVEFLLLDRLFPRSVHHALTTAEQRPRRARPERGRAGRRRRGAPPARPAARRARVPPRRRRAARPARSSSSACSASAATCTPPSRAATSVRPDVIEWRPSCRSGGRCRGACCEDPARDDVRLRRRRARVVQRGAHLAARHAAPVHARAPGRGRPRGQPVPLPRLLGQPRPRVRPPPAAHASSRWSARRWWRLGTARRASTGPSRGTPSTRPGLPRPAVRVPPEHTRSPRPTSTSAEVAAELRAQPTPGGRARRGWATGSAPPSSTSTGWTDVSHDRGRGAAGGPGRVPGLRARRARGPPRRRHPGRATRRATSIPTARA